ncbi:LCP family protein [Georgenia sp. TF02-10]|uniref:LCP family protein n=1 Tax=Georgenia sp. TF02-10 TaxID=2917725 RepID=UPI001FA6EED6|nr:LCP family protein [Georgenia sp. TF02-10]UNX55726.1 LCP family protein [Georgenia sp. TF02-10]
MSQDDREPPPPSFPPAGARRPAPRSRPAAPPRPRDGAARDDRSGPDAPPVRRRSFRSAPDQPARSAPDQPPRSARDQPPSYRPGGEQRAAPGAAPSYPPGGQPRPGAARGAAATRVAPAQQNRPAPAQPGRPAPASPARPARRRRRPLAWALAVVLVLLVAWPAGLLVWANGKIRHTEALTGSADTPGTTYLLAGSDSRGDGAVADPTAGQRSDTVMVMHVPADGPTALISLPRDTLVDVPGHGQNKLNAAFSLGGAPLLTQTVEELTGLTMDHYVEIGMGGVRDVVDAAGGVDLCLDYDVDDELSGLQWTAGCHPADGATALAFARMRYSDPTGDIGRGERQRQVVGAVVKKVATPATVVNPVQQVRLLDAGTGALLTGTGTGIIDLGRMALAFRNATGPDGLIGTPPVASFDYHPGGLGSTVLLADDAPEFFAKMRDGELRQADLDAPA